MEKKSNYQILTEVFLLLSVAELLHINCVLHLQTLLHRRLNELLTSAKLLGYTSSFKLSLKLLESSLDVLSVLDRYNNHVLLCNVLNNVLRS